MFLDILFSISEFNLSFTAANKQIYPITANLFKAKTSPVFRFFPIQKRKSRLIMHFFYPPKETSEVQSDRILWILRDIYKKEKYTYYKKFRLPVVAESMKVYTQTEVGAPGKINQQSWYTLSQCMLYGFSTISASQRQTRSNRIFQ